MRSKGEGEIYCIIIPRNKYVFVRKTDMIILIYDMQTRLPGTVCARTRLTVPLRARECVCVCGGREGGCLVSLRGAAAEGQRDIHKYRWRE